VTRYKGEFEVAVKDEGADKELEKFKQHLEGLFGKNVPAQSGWVVTRNPEYTKVEATYDFMAPKPPDPAWEMIVEWIFAQDKMRPMSTRSRKMTDDFGTVYCFATLYDDRTFETKSKYMISCYKDSYSGQLKLKVDGPFEDASDQYWIEMAEQDKANGNAIITEDWVHRTVHPDKPKSSRDYAGHGGSEFAFRLHSWPRSPFCASLRMGLQIKEVEFEEDGDNPHGVYEVLTTRNCWYQGKIPAKHRHLFKVNAKMVQGFNPTINPA
jgi:hypothetical protein